MEQNEIQVGACYRDPDDGEIARVLEPADGPGWRVRVLGGDPHLGEQIRDLRGWERVPDPTPAVREDACLEDAEAARQARVDATARELLVRGTSYVSAAYDVADALEAARERYIAARRKR